MKLSARTEYAIKAMYELVRSGGKENPLTVSFIAKAQSIPPNFLTQLFLRLSHAGLVRSVRGSGGGYRLNMPPSTITVLDIIKAVDRVLLEQHFDEKRKPRSTSESVLAEIIYKLDHQAKTTLGIDLETMVLLGEGAPLDFQI